MRRIRLGGRDDEDADAAPEEVTRRLTAGMQDMAASADIQVDVQSVVRLGARKVRRRRNVTAGGVAVAVVAMVIGGTIVGRPRATAAPTAHSGIVPVCPSSSASRSESWVASGGFDSLTTEGPSAAVVTSGEASPEGVAQTAAASAASAAKQAIMAAQSAGAQAAAASTSDDPAVQQYLIAGVDPPAWISNAKALQLTDAARGALPTGVKVLGGSSNELTFDSSNVGVATVAVPGTARSRTVSLTMVSAGGDVFRAGPGWGTLDVAVGLSAIGVPICSATAVDHRYAVPDGTVVDVGPSTAGDFNQAWIVPPTTEPERRTSTTPVTARAYRPDGTVVVVTMNATGSATALPMSDGELAAYAANPQFDVKVAPNASQSSLGALITTDSNGNQTTMQARPQSASATQAASAPTSPTR